MKKMLNNFCMFHVQTLNPFQNVPDYSTVVNVNIPRLYSMSPNDVSVNGPVNHQFYIKMDFNRIDNYDYHRHGLYGFYQGMVV